MRVHVQHKRLKVGEVEGRIIRSGPGVSKKERGESVRGYPLNGPGVGGKKKGIIFFVPLYSPLYRP